MNETAYPYKAIDQTCAVTNESVAALANTSVTNYTDIAANSSAALQAAVA